MPGAPTGPGGTVTFYNLDPSFFGAAFQEPVWQEEDALDTDYDGVELTVAKRFSGRWQMLMGLTLGRNEGGGAGFTVPVDLNDPNNALNFFDGLVGLDSTYAFRLSGSYVLPGDLTLAGQPHLQQRTAVPVDLHDHACGVPGAHAGEPGGAPQPPRRRAAAQRDHAGPEAFPAVPLR